MSGLIGSKPLSNEDLQSIISFHNFLNEEFLQSVEKKSDLYLLRNYLYFLFGIRTGFRNSEILSIKLGHVYDFEGKECKKTLKLSGKHMKHKPIGSAGFMQKKGILLGELNANIITRAEYDKRLIEISKVKSIPPKTRIVPMSSDVMLLIKWLIKFWKKLYGRDPDTDDYMIQAYKSTGNNRMDRTNANCLLKKTLIRCGVDHTKYSPHCLRKTYANLLYKHCEKDIVSVSRAIGHSSVKTTMHYLANDDDKIKSFYK